MAGLIFPDSYFEDEVRDGFFVPAEIKRAWSAELEVLYEVDKVCTKHNIPYFADWGTLLATVRHEGYIPWDDDLDIVMKRKDYERFMKIAPKELPTGFAAYNFHNHEDLWLFLGRVVGKQRICFEPDHLKRFHQFPYIAGVDIFVLDYVCRDEEREQERNKAAMSAIALADSVGEGHYDENLLPLLLTKLEGDVHRKIDRSLRGNALRRELYSVAEELFGRFSESEADELTQLYPFGLKDKNFRFPKECYERSVRLPYENTTIPVPEQYGWVLSKRYGEYMHLIRNVGGHDYPFFALQHKQLLGVLDFELPQYVYSKEKAGRSGIDKPSGGTFKSVVAEYCEALKEVCGNILALSAVIAGNEKQVNAEGIKNAALNTDRAETMDANEAVQMVSSLCGELQQLAIDLGSLIERFRGEGFSTVGVLEQLCNAVYFVYEAPEDGEKAQALREACQLACDSAKQDILSHREIVFMPDNPKHWAGFQKYYSEAVADPHNDVYVIPVPYYYKNYDGSMHDRQYLTDGYPAQVVLTSYEAYEWELCYPDIIYIQNPYDEWHVSTTVPEAFYSRQLLRYTENLIYIPWFSLEEFTKENEREFYNMKYYAVMPGVVNADKVIVPSEGMRENYIEKLTKWAGKATRPLWEEKITCDLAENTDRSVSEQKISGEKAEENAGVKTIIYYIQLSSFLEHGQKMIDKIQYSLDIFKESDIRMVWIVEEQAERDLQRLRPKLYEQYLEKKAYCEREVGSVILRSASNPCDELIRQAAAYYGDRGRVALEFEVAKKPVMIQDVDIL